MKYINLIPVIIVLLCTLMLPVQLLAQADSRLDELEQRMVKAEQAVLDNEAIGLAAFACAALCALWAQQTGRNAWLWFFLGLFFNFITLLVMLYKNSKDKRLEG